MNGLKRKLDNIVSTMKHRITNELYYRVSIPYTGTYIFLHKNECSRIRAFLIKQLIFKGCISAITTDCHYSSIFVSPEDSSIITLPNYIEIILYMGPALDINHVSGVDFPELSKLHWDRSTSGNITEVLCQTNDMIYKYLANIDSSEELINQKPKDKRCYPQESEVNYIRNNIYLDKIILSRISPNRTFKIIPHDDFWKRKF
ncbi:MAG: hypothetical protein GY804_08970 [Alphaproteobacteria bacterium]|nr:hypothetical protein [Alphaproteobacteria bacterium]